MVWALWEDCWLVDSLRCFWHRLNWWWFQKSHFWMMPKLARISSTERTDARNLISFVFHIGFRIASIPVCTISIAFSYSPWKSLFGKGVGKIAFCRLVNGVALIRRISSENWEISDWTALRYRPFHHGLGARLSAITVRSPWLTRSITFLRWLMEREMTWMICDLKSL